MNGKHSGAPPQDPALRRMRILMHLPSFVRLHWRLLRDPRVGLPAKLIMIMGIVYAAIPLAPMAMFGVLDDILVLYLASRIFIRLSPRTVVEEHVYLIDHGG